MKCEKCGCTIFARLDNEYIRCMNCSKLIYTQQDAGKPSIAAKVKMTFNAQTAVMICEWITANWDELTALRGDSVAWSTIVKTVDCPCAASTLAKHYRTMNLIRNPNDRISTRGRRKQFYNYDIQQRYVKNNGLIMGAAF